MAVAGCVFNLNRGNFSPITKFIGTALALRSTHTEDRPRFKHRDRARHVDALSPSSSPLPRVCETHDERGEREGERKLASQPSLPAKNTALRSSRRGFEKETCYFAENMKIAAWIL